MSKPNLINDIYLTATNITTFGKDGKDVPLRYASGFFYPRLKTRELFLITNKHVVIEPKEDYYPQSIKLRLHTNATNIRDNIDYDIPLYDNGRRLWRET